MTFYTFMMRNHLNEDSPKGDLAGDIKRDKASFPKNGKGKLDRWHFIIRSFLERQNACDPAMDIFEECWREYVECEKRR